MNSDKTGRDLKDFRLLMGWSQRRLAEEFRVSHGAVANWENGQNPIPGPISLLMDIYEENLAMIDKKKQSKINSDWTSRTLRSGMLVAKLATNIASNQVKSLVAANENASKIKTATDTVLAKHVAQSLGELKGLVMKIGQMASYLSTSLPPEIKEVLSTLQDSATAMDSNLVEHVFRNEFKVGPKKLFKEWDPHPIAAASIGQVHRAVLPDGTEVAVKVQYPGIDKSIQTDLKNSAVIQKFAALVFRNQNTQEILDELKEKLLEECDYLQEADNMETFANILAEIPGVKVPKVFRDFTTKRILTTEYIPGQRFKEFLETASQEEKNQAGLKIFESAIMSIFKHHKFNCDPHPGNFLFHDGQIYFLDFGCTKTFSEEFIKNWRKLFAAHLYGSDQYLTRHAHKIGMIPRLDQVSPGNMRETMKALNEPWEKDRIVKFSEQYIRNTWNKIAGNPERFKLALPRDWVFTNRLQWGLCGLLADLQAEGNFSQIWYKYVQPEEFKDEIQKHKSNAKRVL